MRKVMSNINELVFESFLKDKTPDAKTMIKSISGGVAGAYILQQILTDPVHFAAVLKSAIIPGTIVGGAYGLGKISSKSDAIKKY